MTEALTHTPQVSPALMPKVRKLDPVKRRGRVFGLGERNPKTLPYVHNDSETREENDRRTAHWRKVGKLVKAGRFIGSKY
jgi:hypothetical protein